MRVVTAKLELRHAHPDHPRIADLAGSGLVLVGFLLAAMVLSAVPAVIQGLARRDQPAAQPAAASHISGSGRSTS